jgi:hypothetical protein
VPFALVGSDSEQADSRLSLDEIADILSELDEVEYERQRIQLAKRFGLRVSALDRLYETATGVKRAYKQAQRQKSPEPALNSIFPKGRQRSRQR